MSDVDKLKGRVIAEVDALREALIHLSDTIHAHPELAVREFESAALLSRTLEENGFAVERGVAGLETAFVATLRGKDGGPTVAFLAEYDALAGLGHACGHNIIGTAAVGAGLAMRDVLPELAGTIQVIGTPAEEGGGGKAIMADAGVFVSVDAAVMIHPSRENLIGRLSLTAYPVSIEFFGQAAHAAGSPDLGINALEALLLTFSHVNALRQHLRDDARVHGIITHGGDAPNIVPDYAAASFIVRAADTPYATEVLEKVRACAEGAAQATGARLEFKQTGPRYDARMPNPRLVSLFRDNMAALGLEVKLATGDERMGSSDIGNVSQVVPAIHPYIAIGPDDLVGHSNEFRQAAASPAGHEGLINGAKALAMTAVDLLARPANVIEAKEAFDEQKKQQGG
ncbi:MAG: M20 family metallopeptidase [Anaerolineae bacterium]|nr:MAG: M20 family metallopeptidase [Anaerolineae bacterium]